MRPRVNLLAIPPESADEEMSLLQHVSRGLYFEGQGPGGSDYLCGRCGRLLALNIDGHRIRNVWLACPKCSWLNGFDLDLGWAKYVVRELQERKLSLQRVEQLLTELRQWQGSADDFIARNPDLSKGPVSWLAKISISTLLAILTLLYVIYSGQRSDEIAHEQLHVAQEQVAIAKDQSAAALTPQDLQRLAAELHRLQQELRVNPPPRSTRRR